MTLVIAIAAMAILAITTTGVIVSATANEYTANRSLQQRGAFAVAQQALAYGEGMVYGDVQGSPRVTPPTTMQSLPSQPGSATGTYIACYWDGSACTSTVEPTWHIVATGTVGAATRTVSANVKPSQTVTVSGSTAIWDYASMRTTRSGAWSTAPSPAARWSPCRSTRGATSARPATPRRSSALSRSVGSS